MAEPCRGDIEAYIAASPWSDWAVGVPDKPVREWGGLNWANYALALLARLSAKEARAEAAEQALHEIAAADGSNDPTWWGSSPEHLRSIARAALAGREETGGG